MIEAAAIYPKPNPGKKAGQNLCDNYSGCP